MISIVNPRDPSGTHRTFSSARDWPSDPELRKKLVATSLGEATASLSIVNAEMPYIVSHGRQGQ
jgi:hypothetical protein